MGWMPSAPKADPAIGQAALEQAALGREAAAVAREELAYNKEQDAKYAPYYDAILKQTVDQGAKDIQRSDNQWEQYIKTFQPIENQWATEASTYMTPEKKAQREGLAAQTAGTQFDVARDMTNRDLERRGVRWDGGTMAGVGLRQANDRAIGVTGAVNNERQNSEMLDLSLKQQVAQFGRNMPNTSIAQDAAALNNAQGAQGTIGSQTQRHVAGLQPAFAGYGTALQGLGGSANTLLSKYGVDTSAYRAKSDNFWKGLSTAETAIGAIISDESKKEDKQPLDAEKVADAVAGLRVDRWKYKDGVADGKHHIGPYAQEFSEKFGGDGKTIDVISAVGVAHAASKGNTMKIRKLEKKIDALLARDARAGGLTVRRSA